MAAVYILLSEKLDRLYTGNCKDFKRRFQDHLNAVYPESVTSRSDDWKLFLLIENLSYRQARSIESHIKRMKSRIYIENLLKYPEMITKLKEQYA